VLYSVMPPEDVWGERTLAEAAGGRWVPLSPGRLLYVAPGPLGECIVRLISPEPRDYLDPGLQPGAPWPAPQHHPGR
jgi:hypothetical protein